MQADPDAVGSSPGQHPLSHPQLLSQTLETDVHLMDAHLPLSAEDVPDGGPGAGTLCAQKPGRRLSSGPWTPGQGQDQLQNQRDPVPKKKAAPLLKNY